MANSTTTVCLANTEGGAIEQHQTGWTIQSTIPSTTIASFLWRGPWLLNNIYATNDVVQSTGNAWICIIGHTATAERQPPLTADGGNTWWDLFVAGGNVNSTGLTGGSGSAGAGNNYVEITIDGSTYKVLHDGTV